MERFCRSLKSFLQFGTRSVGPGFFPIKRGRPVRLFAHRKAVCRSGFFHNGNRSVGPVFSTKESGRSVCPFFPHRTRSVSRSGFLPHRTRSVGPVYSPHRTRSVGRSVFFPIQRGRSVGPVFSPHRTGVGRSVRFSPRIERGSVGRSGFLPASNGGRSVGPVFSPHRTGSVGRSGFLPASNGVGRSVRFSPRIERGRSVGPVFSPHRTGSVRRSGFLPASNGVGRSGFNRRQASSKSMENGRGRGIVQGKRWTRGCKSRIISRNNKVCFNRPVNKLYPLFSADK